MLKYCLWLTAAAALGSACVVESEEMMGDEETGDEFSSTSSMLGGGYYVYNAVTGLCLEGYQLHADSNGGKVRMVDCSDGTNHANRLWRLTDTNQLCSVANGLCLNHHAPRGWAPNLFSSMTGTGTQRWLGLEYYYYGFPDAPSHYLFGTLENPGVFENGDPFWGGCLEGNVGAGQPPYTANCVGSESQTWYLF